MTTLSELQAQNDWTNAQTVKFAVDKLNMDEAYAFFALAMEKGEVDGDVVVVDSEEAQEA